MNNLVILYDKENNINKISDNGFDHILQEMSLDAYENTPNGIYENIEILKIEHDTINQFINIIYYIIRIDTKYTKFSLTLPDNELVVMERKDKILKLKECMLK